MADIKWEGATVSLTELLTTSLNTLPNGWFDDGGQTAINNETNLCTHMDLSLYLGSIDLSAQSNPSVSIYMLESINSGVSFDTYTDGSVLAATHPSVDKICAAIGFRKGVGAETKYAVRTMIPISPGYFKLGLLNNSGATFAASGNTLAYRTYNIQSV